jgi:NADPH:quinone reductase-like Zn-dependent oxidoreductase
MKAIRLHGRGGPDHLVYEEVSRPSPAPGEVLVRVAATAVIANELTWDETYQTPDGAPRPFPIPGHDFSGVVAELGPHVANVSVGDAVYALTAFDRDGAEAEFAIALPAELAPRPRTLDDTQAAAVPLAALTAWQALVIRASLARGQTILIHGGAGGVGTYAVQIARWVGAKVFATASARDVDFVRRLGADRVIDYASEAFDNVVRDVDVIFDVVGGDALARSWEVAKPGGVLVSVVSPRPTAPPLRDDVRFVWFIVEPSGDQLRQIGELIDAEDIRPIVDRTFPLAEARGAFEAAAHEHPRGKIVLTVG